MPSHHAARDPEIRSIIPTPLGVFAIDMHQHVWRYEPANPNGCGWYRENNWFVFSNPPTDPKEGAES